MEEADDDALGLTCEAEEEERLRGVGRLALEGEIVGLLAGATAGATEVGTEIGLGTVPVTEEEESC